MQSRHPLFISLLPLDTVIPLRFPLVFPCSLFYFHRIPILSTFPVFALYILFTSFYPTFIPLLSAFYPPFISLSSSFPPLVSPFYYSCSLLIPLDRLDFLRFLFIPLDSLRFPLITFTYFPGYVNDNKYKTLDKGTHFYQTNTVMW